MNFKRHLLLKLLIYKHTCTWARHTHLVVHRYPRTVMSCGSWWRIVTISGTTLHTDPTCCSACRPVTPITMDCIILLSITYKNRIKSENKDKTIVSGNTPFSVIILTAYNTIIIVLIENL